MRKLAVVLLLTACALLLDGGGAQAGTHTSMVLSDFDSAPYEADVLFHV